MFPGGIFVQIAVSLAVDMYGRNQYAFISCLLLNGKSRERERETGGRDEVINCSVLTNIVPSIMKLMLSVLKLERE